LSQRLYAVRRTGLAALSYAPDDGGEGLHGVGVTHAALTYRATALALLGQVGPQDRVYLDEPLGSTYGQAVLGLQLASGFALAIDGRPGQALLSLRTVRPSVVAATVRLLDQVRARAERDSGERRLDRRSAERAFDVARQVHDARAAGRAPTGRLSRRHRSLDRKVLAGVRAHFGDRLRFVVVAGGGLDADLADYFALVGVTVLEAYGTPESGPVSVALRDESGTRTAGRPLPGTEVAISDEGEIEVRGPGLAEGYDHDRGWWHTGDSGVLDDEGRLRVLGRLVRRR
jgi:long-chain acyl-CoA synthetase